MIRVDIVCGNDYAKLQLIRANLAEVFLRLDLPPHWHEWSSKDEDTPSYVEGFPPLTVFVNGAPLPCKSDSPGELYVHTANFLERVVRERYCWTRFKPSKKQRYLFIAATLPFLLMMLIPSIECPFCWPGYNFGDIDMLGIRYFTVYLFPVIIAVLTLTLTAFIYRSYLKKSFQPFFLVLVAVLAVLSSKIISYDAVLEYAGLILYLLATIWQLAESEHLDYKNCPACRALKITNEAAS